MFRKTRWLIGPAGARCTTELKKVVRKEYQRHDDIHIFGFTFGEEERRDNFLVENFELYADFPLIDNGYRKADCHNAIRAAGIALPAMYLLGYKNNNCIGCVKGGMGYWNKIRVDFPRFFWKMARLERFMGVTILSKRGTRKDGTTYRHRLYLDKLDPSLGRYDAEPDIECGVICTRAAEETLPVFVRTS